MTYFIEDEDELPFMEEAKRQAFFSSLLAPSPFHWHFTQAANALKKEYYLPGISGLLNGIEASLRTTLTAIAGRELQGDLGTLMSTNGLLREARIAGMQVELLALPGETDFLDRIAGQKKAKIVQLRNDICHGNFTVFGFEYEGIRIFTPECLLPISHALLDVAYQWAIHLSEFLEDRHLLPPSSERPTEAPQNPLLRRCSQHQRDQLVGLYS